jgi:preprotein translocase subunit YajC
VIAYFWHSFLLAQAEAQGQAPAATPDQAPGISDGTRLLFMILITGVLFYFIMLRPQKRKEQALRDRINNLKENERVVTIGGIHGVVTNVQRDSERVTIRVDEATGTKLRVNLSAIARVVTGEEEEGAASGTKS